MVALKVVDSMGYCERANEQIPNYDFFSETNEKPDFCPLVEVEERKVGKWKYDRGSYICPFCEHEITGKEDDLNYCCKCGAEMKGESNNDNT